MTSREFQDRLARRARQAGIAVPAPLGERLEAYYRLLAFWNRKINLTALALADPSPETLDRLLIEPLAAASYVGPAARRMLDVGSGGGSPAIPMALALDRIELRMVEAKTRKSVFLREAIRSLGLRNAEVLTGRIEELPTQPLLREAHDLVTVRAVKIDRTLLGVLANLLNPGGSLFLFQSSKERPARVHETQLMYFVTRQLTGPDSQLVVLTKPVASPSV